MIFLARALYREVDHKLSTQGIIYAWTSIFSSRCSNLCLRWL